MYEKKFHYNLYKGREILNSFTFQYFFFYNLKNNNFNFIDFH